MDEVQAIIVTDGTGIIFNHKFSFGISIYINGMMWNVAASDEGVIIVPFQADGFDDQNGLSEAATCITFENNYQSMISKTDEADETLKRAKMMANEISKAISENIPINDIQDPDVAYQLIDAIHLMAYTLHMRYEDVGILFRWCEAGAFRAILHKSREGGGSGNLIPVMPINISYQRVVPDVPDRPIAITDSALLIKNNLSIRGAFEM